VSGTGSTWSTEGEPTGGRPSLNEPTFHLQAARLTCVRKRRRRSSGCSWRSARPGLGPWTGPSAPGGRRTPCGRRPNSLRRRRLRKETKHRHTSWTLQEAEGLATERLGSNAEGSRSIPGATGSRDRQNQPEEKLSAITHVDRPAAELNPAEPKHDVCLIS